MSMTELSNHSTSTRPGLGTTYEGYNPDLWERVLPFVNYLEVTPDALAQAHGDEVTLDPRAMAELRDLSTAVPILAHGVGLSIGSHNGWSEGYVRLLDDFVAQVPVAWTSEHLGYTTVDGENIGTMLAMPKTQEALDMVAGRIQALQHRYGRPFLIENIIHILPDYPGDYSEAGFLNALAARTGCGVILDIYNLECDAHNHGFDIPAFLDEIDLANVWELHVACGIEHRGLLLDVHSRLTRDSTIDLAGQVIARAEGAVQLVTYEILREALPALGHDAFVGELARLRRVFCD
jgi:uncharacterized protein (UPF0276 family)